jgi:hypothetical protein
MFTIGSRTMLVSIYRYGNYAAYRNAAGIILADLRTGRSTYFQPGDEAETFESKAERIATRIDEAVAAGNSERASREEGVWNRYCGGYDEVMESSKDAGGAPSPDGNHWVFAESSIEQRLFPNPDAKDLSPSI